MHGMSSFNCAVYFMIQIKKYFATLNIIWQSVQRLISVLVSSCIA